MTLMLFFFKPPTPKAASVKFSFLSIHYLLTENECTSPLNATGAVSLLKKSKRLSWAILLPCLLKHRHTKDHLIEAISMEFIKEQRRKRRERRKKDRIEAFRKVTNNPEVLAMIFIRCLSKDVTRPNRKRAPLNVAHVCKYWRDVAHGTPKLWSSIQLKHVNLDQRAMDRHISLLKHWFSLSSNLLMTIHLHYPFSKKLLPCDTLEGIAFVQESIYHRVFNMLDFVSKHSEILKEVVVATTGGLLLPIIHMLQVGPPNLEKCQVIATKGNVSGASIWDDRHSMPMHINLVRCSKLLELNLACQFASDTTVICLPPSIESLEVLGFYPSLLSASSLKRLVLRNLHHDQEIGDGYPWRTIQSIPNFSPELTYLEVTFTGRNSNIERLTELLTLPKLRSLRVTVKGSSYLPSGDEEAEQFFNHLSVPALKSLRLDWCRSYEEDPVHWPSLKNHLLQSKVDLDTLILESVEFADDDVLSLLECAHNLHVLYVSGRHLTERLVSCLTLRHQSTGQDDTGKDLCPHIRDLTLRLGKIPASAQSVMQLVNSRREEYEDNPDSGVLMRFAFNMVRNSAENPPKWHPDAHSVRSHNINSKPY